VQNESVTIQIHSSTFAKVIATANRPISVSVNNLKTSLIAGETLTALQVYRGFSFISQTLSTTV